MTDASCQLVSSRLKEIVAGFQGLESQPSNSQLAGTRLYDFHQYTTPTLPHLLALVAHHSISFPPSGTSLIVIDAVSTLFALAFPRASENLDNAQTPVKKSDVAQRAAGRRWTVMGDLISKLGRLAATKNIAILLTSQTTTRIRHETRAVLHPAISSSAWDGGISTRVVLFRDWLFRAPEGPSSQGECVPGARFAGITKARGVSYDGIGRVITFTIEKVSCYRYSSICNIAKKPQGGLREIKVDQAEINLNASPMLPTTATKRKRGEIADSESDDEKGASDQEFGWAENDDVINAEGLLD